MQSPYESTRYTSSSSGVEHAMYEETLADITSQYPFWNRSVSLTQYYMNKAALEGDWNTILFMLRYIPYEKSSEEYISIYSFIAELVCEFGVQNLIPQVIQIGYLPLLYSRCEYHDGSILTVSIVTPNVLDRLDRILVETGEYIHIEGLLTGWSSGINPLILEHTYQWWNIHNQNDIEDIVYNIHANPVERLAIATAADIPLSENIIEHDRL